MWNSANWLSQVIRIFTQELFEIGNTSVSIVSIAYLVVSLAIALLLTRGLRNFLKYRLLVKFGIDEGNRAAIATIFSYGLGILSVIAVLQILGFDLSSLAVVAGGLGVGIGFGLQNMANNFISGVTILIERKLKVGDFIEFDGLSGYIKEVFLQSTVIRTREGADVVVPNSQLISNRVVNWSYDNCYVARVHIPVGVAYGSDPVQVTETLLVCAYMEPSVVSDPPPKVMLKGFGDSALLFELWVWVDRIDREPFIVSSLNFFIEYYLRQQGIKIPFPQTEVWFNSPQAAIDWNSPPFGSVRLHSSPHHNTTDSIGVSLSHTLRQISYFENLNELQLRQLIEQGCRKTLSPGDILFQEGEPGDAFYIVIFGKVEVYVERLDRQLKLLDAGSFFGELALMLGVPRTASVRALEPTILFKLDRFQFERLLCQHPELYDAIVAGLERHKSELARRQQELRSLGLVDVDEDDKNPIDWVKKRFKNLFNL